MKIDVDALEKSIDGFFEAASEPSRWERTMMEISQATGSVGSAVIPVWGRSPGIPFTPSLGRLMEDYFDEGWHQREFRMRGLSHLLRHGSMLDQDYATQDDFKNEAYFRFLDKFNLRWTAIIGFENGSDGKCCFCLYRSLADGPFDREEEAVISRLRDRLTMSATIMQYASRMHNDGMAEAFNVMNLACIFFDRHSQVTRVNRSAEKLIGQGIQISQGQIRSHRQSDADAVRNRVSAAINGTLLNLKNGGLPLPITRNGRRPLIVRVQRLSGNSSDIFTESAVIATVVDPDAELIPSSEALVGLFGLTRSEARIAQALAAGGSPRAIAEEKSLSYETVRSHIASILRKTDTSRQSELASLFSKVKLGGG